MKTDASEDSEELYLKLEKVDNFVKSNKTNAFLVGTRENDWFEVIEKLIHLRLIHVISEGITIGTAGKKALGLILDYGFYTGIRAACLLYTSPSPRDRTRSRMPSSA